MKKFAGEIIRTDEYSVEIDETIWTPEALEDWSNVFFECNDLEDLAKHVTQAVMRLGTDHGFIEGFGFLKIIESSGRQVDHWENGKPVPEGRLCDGITVHIISHDNDYSNELKEVDS